MNTREVQDKYNLTKGQIDNLVNRNKKKWGLFKDENGNFIWNEGAIKKLEGHLSKQIRNDRSIAFRAACVIEELLQRLQSLPALERHQLEKEWGTLRMMEFRNEK